MQNIEAKDKTSPPRRNWRRAKVTASVLLAMVFSGVAITPTVLINSAYRDQVLNQSLKKKGLTATTESGSGSWLTAPQITGLHITDETGAVEIRIKSITMNRSLFSLMMQPNNLGLITVDSPEFQLTLDENGELPASLKQDSSGNDDSENDVHEKNRPDIAFDIRNAAVKLAVPWRDIPIVEVDRLEIAGKVATNNNGQRWLNVDAVQVFDHEALSDLHTQQNLALVAPILSKTTQLNGEVSLRFDPIHHQLHTANSAPINLAGHATLHSVKANLTADWAQQLAEMTGRLGEQNSTGGLEIVKDSQVDFAVVEEGIYHEGLAFVLPQTLGQTQISSSGTVGFDESVNLDFRVKMPTPGFGGVFASSITRMLSGPIVMTVTGTISEPKLAPPPGLGIVDQLSENMRPGSSNQPAPSIPNTVLHMIGSSTAGSAAPSDEIAGGILDMIRAVRDAKQKQDSAPQPKLEDTKQKQLTPRERREQRRARRRTPSTEDAVN